MPSEFCLFHKLKEFLGGRLFQNNEMKVVLNGLSTWRWECTIFVIYLKRLVSLFRYLLLTCTYTKISISLITRVLVLLKIHYSVMKDVFHFESELCEALFGLMDNESK